MKSWKRKIGNSIQLPAESAFTPEKSKAWLEANSLSGSERTRQRYAQERLDMKRARQAERREIEQMPHVFQEMPRRVEGDQTSTRSFGLVQAVITGLVLAWLAHHWLG
ncbi:hypothetical protein [Mesorhizobium sp.]|uniref:hypothetical protein n=1 Tax=Mesorhizobium sp. TaxID=1871066 RepID=UPI000FE34F5B|nr:hypothetical protein [Mesorhizobium sp.]RWA69437.1 MAG: hypothetical protein EOQ28_22975 [Mesorhizobium sp.]RWC03061.1 MAG: hypothetical protein EOQ57_08430 [Mesorhizobium sp.]RWK15290.1 MAG: hypothetical protein EOR41_24225 [Mesorhizobium sp.]RWK23098.1 MAG: hypothetical protein EOR43_15350 [Mesorhizobium sp.]RWK30511.1 MAG: hypothetical protein EOR44_16835 [Mesorhizobium sp.]